MFNFYFNRFGHVARHADGASDNGREGDEPAAPGLEGCQDVGELAAHAVVDACPDGREGVVEEGKVQEFSRDIYKESQRLIALIDDIIKLSKLDEDSVEPEWENVDLYSLSGEVLDGLRTVADKQGIKLKLTGSPATVSGVYALISEMVYNLCDNAIKYNTPGGSVTVDVSPRDNEVLLSVKDTGIGIPPEHQKRVFERFYRVDKSHSKEIGGTGLGLSIVKHGAAHHGAKVSLESEPGKGTKITLPFPVKKESVES